VNERCSRFGSADFHITECDAVAEPSAQRLRHRFFRGKLTGEVCETVNPIWDSGFLSIREVLSDEISLTMAEKALHRIKLDEVKAVGEYSHDVYTIKITTNNLPSL